MIVLINVAVVCILIVRQSSFLFIAISLIISMPLLAQSIRGLWSQEPVVVKPKINIQKSVYKEVEMCENARAQNTCVICLQDYLEEEEIGVLSCAHYYHYNCICKWCKQDSSCPMKCNLKL